MSSIRLAITSICTVLAVFIANYFLLLILQASSRIEGNKLILEGVYIDEDKSPFKIVRYIENDRLVEVTL